MNMKVKRVVLIKAIERTAKREAQRFITDTANKKAIRRHASVLDLLFGCLCENYTFPQTLNGDTTVSCLDCGQTWFYDLNAMKVSAKAPRTITCAPDSHTGTLLEDLTKMVEERVR